MRSEAVARLGQQHRADAALGGQPRGQAFERAAQFDRVVDVVSRRSPSPRSRRWAAPRAGLLPAAAPAPCGSACATRPAAPPASARRCARRASARRRGSARAGAAACARSATRSGVVGRVCGDGAHGALDRGEPERPAVRSRVRSRGRSAGAHPPWRGRGHLRRRCSGITPCRSCAGVSACTILSISRRAHIEPASMFRL